MPKACLSNKGKHPQQGQHSNEQTNYIYCLHNAVITIGFKDGHTLKGKSRGKHKPKQLLFLEEKLKTRQKL